MKQHFFAVKMTQKCREREERWQNRAQTREMTAWDRARDRTNCLKWEKTWTTTPDTRTTQHTKRQRTLRTQMNHVDGRKIKKKNDQKKKTAKQNEREIINILIQLKSIDDGRACDEHKKNKMGKNERISLMILQLYRAFNLQCEITMN